MTGGPSKPTEESVSFSLKELARLEQEREREEHAARRRQDDEARAARDAAERRAAEEAAARSRAEDDRRRAEERRVREDEVRLAAIRDGALEQAKLLAASEVRIGEAARQREHELTFERLRREAGVRGLRRGTIVAGIFSAALLAATAGAYFGWLRPAVAHTEAVAAGAAADRDTLRRALDERAIAQKAELDGLAEQLAAARAENAGLKEQLAAARARPCGAGHAGASGSSGGRHHLVTQDPLGAACHPGDPLCP